MGPRGIIKCNASSEEQDVFRHPGFPSFWIAETVSGFGTSITTMALQVLVILSLGGTAGDVGWVNASRWLPYVFLGLIVGALVERVRRKPVLVTTDLGRAALLVAIPILWSVGWLNIVALMGFVALFGVLSLLNDAATQSFLPRLVPPSTLLAANARLSQGDAVAQTSGPVGLAWGAGRTVIACRALMPLGWGIIALVPEDAALWATVAQLAAGQAIYGFGMGAENPNEMGYCQAVTPDAMQGRRSATMRSVNRAMIVIAAPAGGMLADGIGYRPAMWIAIAGFTLVAILLAVSRFRHARHGDSQPGLP